jgi:hypothetical protein
MAVKDITGEGRLGEECRMGDGGGWKDHLDDAGHPLCVLAADACREIVLLAQGVVGQAFVPPLPVKEVRI